MKCEKAHHISHKSTDDRELVEDHKERTSGSEVQLSSEGMLGEKDSLVTSDGSSRSGKSHAHHGSSLP